MDYPYFIFNGTDSRSVGVWVSQYPDRIRAVERVNRITIPGRAGQLTLIEGAAVYEPINLQIRVQTLRKNDFIALQEWLHGAGELVIGHEPDKAYNARVVDEVVFTKYSNDIAEATIAFQCEPFKHQYPLELPVTLTAAGTVINSGNVPAKPFIRLVTSSDVTLTVGDTVFTIAGETGTIDIDCAACMVTKDNLSILSATSGDFPELAVGVNEISWTGTVTSATINVTARWL